MKQLHVQTSPLTNTIYAGHVLKDGRTWAANKQDVTMEALVAVAEHGVRFGAPIVITNKSEPEYRITVEKLTPNAELKGRGSEVAEGPL